MSAFEEWAAVIGELESLQAENKQLREALEKVRPPVDCPIARIIDEALKTNQPKEIQ